MGINSMSIGQVLFTKTQQRVLAVLFGHPDRSYFANELVRLAETGTGTIHRELQKLCAAGLITEKRVGNQRHFQANRDAPIFEELRSIVLKTFGMVDVLREHLEPVSAKISCAFIFGSVAKKEDHAASDIDLLVVSNGISYADLYEILAVAEKKLCRKINPVIYTADEFQEKLLSGNAFACRVIAQPKLFLMGTADDLPKLVGPSSG
jgi:predicted nucleotidyltransferase